MHPSNKPRTYATMHASAPGAARRFLLLLALCGLLSLWLAVPSFAQPRRLDPEQMQQRLAAETDALIQQLALTDAQEAQVRPILAERNEQRVARLVKARERFSREAMTAMRQDLEALNAATDKKLEAILTKAQMAKYRKIQEDRAARRRGRRGM